MYADNIVKMLNNIRKTVRASSKLQPGSNAFAQFLDEVDFRAHFRLSLSFLFVVRYGVQQRVPLRVIVAQSVRTQTLHLTSR